MSKSSPRTAIKDERRLLPDSEAYLPVAFALALAIFTGRLDA